MKRMIAAILLAVLLFNTAAAAETTAWILCKPDSFVFARRNPTKQALELGRLELGDKVTLTGKKKNGYAECSGLTFEFQSGWIHTGYLVYDKPEKDGGLYRNCAHGRTALRRWVDGPRRAWASENTTFRVYARSAEWAVTSKGFIRVEFIEPEGE